MGNRRLGRKRLQAVRKYGEDLTNTSGSQAGSGMANAVTSITRERNGHRVVTEVAVDFGTTGSAVMTSTTQDDIIGQGLGTANCYVYQHDATKGGFITNVEMVCVEAPTGAERDIDLVMSIFPTGTSDAVISTADADHLRPITAGGNWALGTIDHYAATIGTAHDIGGAAIFDDKAYFYMVNGHNGEPGTYATGKWIIVVEGYVASADGSNTSRQGPTDIT